ncbi:MAG TPA: helix-turn-helix domain-containing protein [Chryseolinea sp.]
MSSNIRVTRRCLHCGNDFIAKTTVTKYCGDICAKRAYKKRITLNKTQKSNTETLLIISKPFDELKAKEFLSIADTAALTGVSVRTIQRLIERGSLKATKLGKRTIIHKKQLEKLFL